MHNSNLLTSRTNRVSHILHEASAVRNTSKHHTSTSLLNHNLTPTINPKHNITQQCGSRKHNHGMLSLNMKAFAKQCYEDPKITLNRHNDTCLQQMNYWEHLMFIVIVNVGG